MKTNKINVNDNIEIILNKKTNEDSDEWTIMKETSLSPRISMCENGEDRGGVMDPSFSPSKSNMIVG